MVGPEAPWQAGGALPPGPWCCARPGAQGGDVVLRLSPAHDRDPLGESIPPWTSAGLYTRSIPLSGYYSSYCLCYFFLKDFYLFMTFRERGRDRQREKQAPRKEPDVGLNPGTLGSRPEPKADAQPLSHPGISPYCL